MVLRLLVCLLTLALSSSWTACEAPAPSLAEGCCPDEEEGAPTDTPCEDCDCCAHVRPFSLTVQTTPATPCAPGPWPAGPELPPECDVKDEVDHVPRAS